MTFDQEAYEELESTLYGIIAAVADRYIHDYADEIADIAMDQISTAIGSWLDEQAEIAAGWAPRPSRHPAPSEPWRPVPYPGGLP